MKGKKKLQEILFIDWDETITSHDTLSLIAPPDEKHKGPPFAEYGKAYVEDLKQHEKEWQYLAESSKKNDKITIPRKECNLGKGWEEQWAYQESLDEVELASQKRIEEGGLFLDANPTELENRAIDNVQFRKGWPKVHHFVSNWQYHIISVGWSARFIAAALKKVNGNRFMPTSICANEIEMDESTGLGTGRLTKSYDAKMLEERSFRPGEGGIRTGQHKVREMRRIIQTYPSDLNLITIYVGDSTTDLGSLLEANLGLIIGQSTSLYNTIIKADLERFKVRCSDEKIREIIASQISDNKQPCLIKVNDWEEVREVMNIVNEFIMKSL